MKKRRETIDDVLESPPSPERTARLRALLEAQGNGDSDDDEDVELSPEWAEELHRRVDEIESGTAKARSLDEVMASIRARLR